MAHKRSAVNLSQPKAERGATLAARSRSSEARAAVSKPLVAPRVGRRKRCKRRSTPGHVPGGRRHGKAIPSATGTLWRSATRAQPRRPTLSGNRPMLLHLKRGEAFLHSAARVSRGGDNRRDRGRASTAGCRTEIRFLQPLVCPAKPTLSRDLKTRSDQAANGRAAEYTEASPERRWRRRGRPHRSATTS